MPLIRRSAIVPYSQQQMYDLVNDVQSYPQFLPWCKRTEILDSSDLTLTAKIGIEKGPLRNSFVTRNSLQAPSRIEMDLVSGPFNNMHGHWDFQMLSQSGCQVSLNLDFEMSNPLLTVTLGAVFNKIGNTMVDAFCQRAVSVYG